MTAMNFGKLTKLTLLAALLLSQPAWSSETAAQDKSPFKLSAQMSAHTQLSRTELDSSAVDLAKSKLAASSSGQSSLPPGQSIPVPAFTPAAATAADDASGPNGYLAERNVDWRGWISGLADRWYYTLKTYEQRTGLQYITQGPALIQYTCYSNGTIGNIILRQSSGNDAYDRLQVIALMQTAPLPPFPLGTRRSAIILCQGWESHLKSPGEQDFVPGSFGGNFPMEKVTEWVKRNPSSALSQRP